MKIAIVTIGNEKHGITTYSQFLNNEIKKEISCNIEQFPTNWKKINFKEYMDLADILNKYDIIHIQHEHAFFGGYGIMTIPFYKKLNKKIVTTIHEIFPLKRHFLGHLRDQIFLRYVCMKSDKIIVHTEISKKYLIEKLQINKNKIIVISHGLNIIECDKKESRKKLNLPIDKKIIVIPGFINDNKQYEKIIENSPNDALIIGAGKKLDEKKYILYAKSLDKYKNFKITGFLKHEELEDYICAADFVAVYYKNLTMSGILSIAMGMNKKILTTENETFMEIKEKYENIFPSKDENLKENINKLLLYNNPIKSKYINEITWNKISRKHIELYIKLEALK